MKAGSLFREKCDIWMQRLKKLLLGPEFNLPFENRGSKNDRNLKCLYVQL